MQTGFRFRCYPNKTQAQILLRWIGCQRFIYNAKVGEDRYFRTFARKSLQHAGQYAPQDQQYAHFFTEDTAWLREVPSVVLRNGSVRWKQALWALLQETGRATDDSEEDGRSRRLAHVRTLHLRTKYRSRYWRSVIPPVDWHQEIPGRRSALQGASCPCGACLDHADH